jgi:Transposase DDE domain group 1
VVAAKSRRTGRMERRFKSFMWTTRRTWSRRRRIVAKAEWTHGEANPRFVVTSLGRHECKAKCLYEKLYCARGDMENRIKECQLDLYADRTSTATMRANQLRLWFASMAYVLLCALRRIGLHDTDFAAATCGTIRLKLLKIGAIVRFSVRRIKIAMASACPAARDWLRAAIRLAIADGPRLAGVNAPPQRVTAAAPSPRLTEINSSLPPQPANIQSTPRLQTPQTAVETKLQIIPLSNLLDHVAVVVESSRGAVAWAMRHRPVSPARSSNRTGRFPASGFPTGFIVGHTPAAQGARVSVAALRVRRRRGRRRTCGCLVLAPCAVC